MALNIHVGVIVLSPVAEVNVCMRFFTVVFVLMSPRGNTSIL